MNRFLPLRRMLLLAGSFLALCPANGGGASAAHSGSQVAPCSHIQLSASYLAEARSGDGPRFHFRLANETDRAIVLVRPVPTSAHWYARDGLHWSWRASNGGGGALVDAMSPHGKMFAYQPAKIADASQFMRVAAHSAAEWEQGPRENPALDFKPSCGRCNHPGDHEFRAIFAYAYLPVPQDRSLGLLPCGIRSTPVDVPPLR